MYACMFMWMHRESALRAAALAAVVLLVGCGSTPGEPGTPTTPAIPQPAPEPRWPLNATIVLTAAGPEPAAVTINAGGRVTFVNQDVRSREIVSDPYLRHEECPATNFVGVLAPGQQRESRIYEVAKSCGFHDHGDPAYSGRVIVRID